LIAAIEIISGISPQELRLKEKLIDRLVRNMKSEVFMQWNKFTIKEML
jgi:hypothetical protein